MDPPEFLVPFQLLGRVALRIKKVENPPELVVPSKLEGPQDDIDRPFHSRPVLSAFGNIHDEPHGLGAVAGIDQAAFKAVEFPPVRRHVLA